MDRSIRCMRCQKTFTLNAREQEFYLNLGYQLPKRCKPCRDEIKAEKHTSGNESFNQSQGQESMFVDTVPIVDFVNTIEDAKGFVKDPRLVFAHIVEEVGELSKALWQLEMNKVKTSVVARELIDILFLICYMADIVHVDINDQIPTRIKEISNQYLKEEQV